MSLTSQAHFNDYWPPDFGWGGAHDPEAHSSMRVPFSFNGVNFGQCHRDVHGLFTALLTEIVPHISGGLKSGSCWSYSTTDNLPDGTRSFHSYGIAMDVNWNVNHMGTNIPDAHGKWAIPRALATSLARKYGCEWGGNWSGGYHDNMHFECHLTPAVAATVKPSVGPTVVVSQLEEIMALKRGSTEYNQVVNDIANAASGKVVLHKLKSPVDGKFYTLEEYIRGTNTVVHAAATYAKEAAANTHKPTPAAH